VVPAAPAVPADTPAEQKSGERVGATVMTAAAGGAAAGAAEEEAEEEAARTGAASGAAAAACSSIQEQQRADEVVAWLCEAAPHSDGVGTTLGREPVLLGVRAGDAGRLCLGRHTPELAPVARLGLYPICTLQHSPTPLTPDFLKYQAFGVIGTALSKKIGVLQSSSRNVAPITPTASYSSR
jgi:hypothetical protein